MHKNVFLAIMKYNFWQSKIWWKCS